jgi:hypothetical protein
MYRDMKGSTHVLASPEIAVVAIPEDKWVWVPQAYGRGVLNPCSPVGSLVTGVVLAIDSGYAVAQAMNNNKAGKKRRYRAGR